jgi:hypothetical protein
MIALSANEDLAPYISRKLRLKKFDTAYEGVLLGRGAVVTVATANSHPNSLWVLNDGGTEIHFTHPGDGWAIAVL